MPTKKRRRREQEKRAIKAELDAALPLPIPNHLTAFASNGKNEFDFDLPRGGLVVVAEEGFHFHDNIGKGGNEKRKADRRDDAVDLKRKYPALWGKRGKAKIIAFKAELSERTIQKYFKDFP